MQEDLYHGDVFQSKIVEHSEYTNLFQHKFVEPSTFWQLLGSHILNENSLSKHFVTALTKIADEGCIRFLKKASADTGGLVKMLDKYGHVPILEGSDGNPVLLYKIVEEIESVVDPSEIVDAFPTLSYAQVVSALMFLRNFAQFNTRGINIDEESDKSIESNPDIQAAIIASMNDEETRIVHVTK